MVSAYVAPQTALTALTSYNAPPTGRLTLTTAVPVLTAAVTAAATVFYTPYLGSVAPIWDGSRFVARVFTEKSNVLANSATGSAGPAAGAASKNYDLFLWDNAGTLTLTRGGAWNSDTARSAAAENDLQTVQGLLVNLNAITNGPAAAFGTYVGTIRTDAGGATVTYDLGTAASGGGLASFGVWNLYNQVEQAANVEDSGVSYAFNSSTIRAARASATFRVNLIAGLNIAPFDAQYNASVSLAAVVATFAINYVSLDSTSAATTPYMRGQLSTNVAVALSGMVNASMKALPGLGFHFVSGNEQGDNANNYTVNTTSIRSVLNVKWKW